MQLRKASNICGEVFEDHEYVQAKPTLAYAPKPVNVRPAPPLESDRSRKQMKGVADDTQEEERMVIKAKPHARAFPPSCQPSRPPRPGSARHSPHLTIIRVLARLQSLHASPLRATHKTFWTCHTTKRTARHYPGGCMRSTRHVPAAHDVTLPVLISQTNAIVTTLTGTFIVYTRSPGAAYFAAGAVLCSITVKILKRCLRQPRPAVTVNGRRKKTYGCVLALDRTAVGF